VAFGASHPVDAVVVALPAPDAGMLAAISRQLSAHFLNVQWLPGEAALAGQSSAFGGRGDIPGIPLARLYTEPFRGWRAVCKRCMDFLLALAAIIFLSPLLLLCVIGVKLSDPGPVLFRQSRIGYRNQAFEIYKFRSMFLDRCGHETLTERDDPRVFAFGSIMRKLSFDELPQLFNVLRGDMSLVGPRPHMPEARAGGILYTQAVAAYALRHRVKPGITGWAQVSGWRGPTDTVMHLQRRVDHDLHYIESWSLLLDFKILVKTALMGFFGKNAF
jgi:exopolysaccharide biosynthesis polyprenyl glycosylphosphotransferase